MAVITYEFAKEIGLLKDPYKSRRERFYSEQYLLEGYHQAEERRRIAEIGAQTDEEIQLNLPNCVNRDLRLFEFEEEDIRDAIRRQLGRP